MERRSTPLPTPSAPGGRAAAIQGAETMDGQEEPTDSRDEPGEEPPNDKEYTPSRKRRRGRSWKEAAATTGKATWAPTS